MSKIFLVFIANLIFIYNIKATKFISAKRHGIAKLTFTCKFSTRSERNVTWHLNGFDTVGYPHFQVTNKYLPKQHLLTTTLKVIRPEITNDMDTYTCASNGHRHKFRKVEGIWDVWNGTGWFFFGRDVHKYTFHVDTVRKICKNWNATFIAEKNSCLERRCQCKDIKIFDVEYTVTKKTKIKPVPFLSFKFHDYVNLPGNYNLTIWIDNERDPIVEGINTENVTISREDFLPNRIYYVVIFVHHPFLPYEHNQFSYTTVRKELLVKSSSLRPRTPTVTSAVLEADKCEIIIKFPFNVDVKDTYDHFKPQILVNGEITEKVLRLSKHLFEITVNGRVENIISVRILSTVEKYNSKLSDPITCL